MEMQWVFTSGDAAWRVERNSLEYLCGFSASLKWRQKKKLKKPEICLVNQKLNKMYLFVPPVLLWSPFPENSRGCCLKAQGRVLDGKKNARNAQHIC